MGGDLFGELPPAPRARRAARAARTPLPDNRLTQPLDLVLSHTAPDWQPLVQAWRASAAGEALVRYVDARRSAGVSVYPGQPLRALALTSLARVQVVILGQDPYHGPGQAEGLAFSVPQGVAVPRSLGNILVELQRDLGLPPPGHGHLAAWAQRGVLLLNTVLTVEEGQPASHARRGWEALTDALIQAVALRAVPTVFLLWGGHAQAKAGVIEQAAPGRHLLLQANHPSPLSARRPPVPFIGCGHFSAAQALLPGWDWALPPASGAALPDTAEHGA